MAEQKVYIDNTMSFSNLLYSRKSFRTWAHNKGVLVSLPLCNRIHPSLYPPMVSGHLCESMYIRSSSRLIMTDK